MSGPEAKHTAGLQAILNELQARLDHTVRHGRPGSIGEHLDLVPQIACQDGLTLSVQASAFHYCSPRESRGPWFAVEVGFPSREVPEIREWMEGSGDDDPTETVYAYVPIEAVALGILNAGGFAKASSQ